MHFGKVEVGDRYSVSPEATLGPTSREWEGSKDFERNQWAIKQRLASLEGEE
jgi:hypothetical protein